MGNTIGQFDFDIVKMRKRGDLPFDPQVTIQLKHWGTKDGIPHVSPTLMSESEIDTHIELMKQDLNAVARRAKASLRNAKEQMKALMSAEVVE